MGRRREEEVDRELLAQLESKDGPRIRVPLPKRKVNEMFAIADQMLGGRRVHAVCEDGITRLARIPGKMRRRQWVREGDLIVLQPWDFQDAKADVKKRYTKTQALYLSRKGVLPDIVDIFGAGEDTTDTSDDSGIFSQSGSPAKVNVKEKAEVKDVAEQEDNSDEDDSEAVAEENVSEAVAEENVSEAVADEDDDAGESKAEESSEEASSTTSVQSDGVEIDDEEDDEDIDSFFS
jgi:translation initiation factor 1A